MAVVSTMCCYLIIGLHAVAASVSATTATATTEATAAASAGLSVNRSVVDTNDGIGPMSATATSETPAPALQPPRPQYQQQKQPQHHTPTGVDEDYYFDESTDDDEYAALIANKSGEHTINIPSTNFEHSLNRCVTLHPTAQCVINIALAKVLACG